TLAVTSGPADAGIAIVSQPVYGGTATDTFSVSRVEASVDGAAFSTAGVTCTACGTPSATWTFTPAALPDGNHTFAFRAGDYAANLSAAATRSVRIDTTAPTFNSVVATGGLVTVTALFSEPLTCATVGRGKFSATVNGVARSISSAPCTGTTLQ